MLGLLGALDPYKHKLNQTGGVLVDGNSAAISKDITDSEAGQIYNYESTIFITCVRQYMYMWFRNFSCLCTLFLN